MPAEVPQQTVDDVFRPLSHWLIERRRSSSGPLVVGVGGPPGTGKSTLVDYLGRLLHEGQGLEQAAFSLDDVYLTRQERERLAEEFHPAFAQRGVPGTHDLELAFATLERLERAGKNAEIPLPRFDKGRDDRIPEEQWPRFSGRPAVVALDGWCWGAEPESEDALRDPINDFERIEDPQSVFRCEVNRRLAGRYQALFRRAEAHIHLVVPSWETSIEFRIEQEEQRGRLPEEERPRILSPQGVQEFLQPFERISRRLPPSEPRAAYVYLRQDRSVERLELPNRATD